MSNKDQLEFISKALLMHQRPFLITKLEGDVLWVNNAAKYIFSMDDNEKLDLLFVDKKDLDKAKFDSDIADSFDVFLKLKLRQKSFFMRVLLHVIPMENENYFLVEFVSNSKENLFALKTVISCLEHNRIGMYYQKQYKLTGNKEITGVEALIRFFNEDGSIIPNDKIIPYIEGESIFSLVVTSSMDLVREFFDAREQKGLKGTTLYFNVSAHTVLHKDFLSIFKEFIKSTGVKKGDFGIEVTETAELNTS